MPRGVPGPVKKTEGKRSRRDNLPPGPGPGRPKGVPNKFTGELKAAILDGIHNANPHGLQAWITLLATETPTSAAALLGRLIPVSMQGQVEQHHVIEVRWKPPQ